MIPSTRTPAALIATAALLAVGLLGLIALAPTAEASGHASVDLGVLFGALPPEQEYVVGRPVTVDVVVTNTGVLPSQAYTVDLTWVRTTEANSGGALLQNPETQSARYGNPLAPGASATHRFTWTPSDSQHGDLRLAATVATTGDGNANNNVHHAYVFVKRPVVSVSGDWEPNAERRVRPLQDLLIPFSVKNEGNALDTLVVSLVGGTQKLSGWTVAFNATEFVLRPTDGPVQGVLRLQPAETTPKDTVVGGTTADNNPVLRVASKANPNIRQDIALPKVIVAQSYAVNLTIPVTEHTLTPGQPLTLDVYLENLGNGRDTLNLRVEGPAANDTWLRDWSLGDNVTLEGFSGRQVMRLALTAPPWFPAGNIPVTLVATSLGDESKTSRLTFTLVVRQVYNLHAGIIDPIRDIPPGSTTTFLLNLTNKGNGPDHMSITTGASGIPPGWIVHAEDPRPLVPANGTRFIRIDVTTPKGEPATPADQPAIRITVGVVSEGSINANARNETLLTVFTRVTSAARGAVTFPGGVPSAPYVDPSGSFSYPVSVENVGNLRGTFTVTQFVERLVGSGSWSPASNGTTLTLDPFGKGSAHFTARPPAGARPGDKAQVTMVLRVDNVEAYRTSFNLTVSGPDLELSGLRIDPGQALYQGDPAALVVTVHNRGNLPFTGAQRVVFYLLQGGDPIALSADPLPQPLAAGTSVEVRKILETAGLHGAYTLLAKVDEGVEGNELREDNNALQGAAFVRTWDLRVTAAADQTTVPGESREFIALELRNLGNHEEEIRITIRSPSGWIRAQDRTPPTITLAPGGYHVFNLTARIPTEPGVSTDALTFTLANAQRSDLGATRTLTLHAVDEKPPVFQAVTLEKESFTILDRFNLTAIVRDAFEVKSVVLTLVDPEQKGETHSLAKGMQDRWNASVALRKVGNHRFTLTATDTSGKGMNWTGNFTVVAGSRPTIERLEPNRTTLRAGIDIPLAITDPLGISGVTVSFGKDGKNRTDLPTPYVINTSLWSAGTHKVKVEARNVYGATTSMSFEIKVDNTRPVARVDRDVKLEEPRPNTPFSITVTFSKTDLANVTAYVTQGETTLEYLLTAVEDGKYVLNLPGLNPGEYRLTLRALDVAGNVGGLDRELVFAVKEPGMLERFLPANALLGTLSALGAVALARRRQ